MPFNLSKQDKTLIILEHLLLATRLVTRTTTHTYPNQNLVSKPTQSKVITEALRLGVGMGVTREEIEELLNMSIGKIITDCLLANVPANHTIDTETTEDKEQKGL